MYSKRENVLIWRQNVRRGAHFLLRSIKKSRDPRGVNVLCTTSEVPTFGLDLSCTVRKFEVFF